MSETTPSTTELTTEYGIRQPNGNVAWEGKVTTRDSEGYPREKNMRDIHENPATRRNFIAQLHHTADAAGVDKLEFVSGHRLVTRQRIIITLAPVDADPTIQFGNVNDEEMPWL